MISLRRRSHGPWEWVHWLLTVTWVALIAPTVLWWRDSILWVAMMSIWANVAAHASAAMASRAARKGGGG
jgi:hypothetical protein